MEFAYRAYDAEGRHVRGSLEAADENSALEALRRRELTVFRISEGTGPTADIPWWNREIELFGSRGSSVDLAAFLAALQVLLEAGLPLRTALEFSLEDARGRTLPAAVRKILEAIGEGSGLAQAMVAQPRIFPPRVTALIETGEHTNTLARTVAHAADLIRTEVEFNRRLRAALTYPLILTVASLVVMAGLVFFLTPMLVPIFAGLDTGLPFAIHAMLEVKHFLVRYGAAIAIASGVLVAAFVLAPGRARALVLDRVPLIGSYRRLNSSTGFASVFGLLLESGVPLLEAVRITKDTTRSPALARRLGEAEKLLREGQSLSDTLGEAGELLPLVRRAIRLGEAANELAPLLVSSAIALSRRLETRLSRLTSLVTPVLTLAIGSLVGLMVFSTMTAILDINDVALQP